MLLLKVLGNQRTSARFYSVCFFETDIIVLIFGYVPLVALLVLFGSFQNFTSQFENDDAESMRIYIKLH